MNETPAASSTQALREARWIELARFLGFNRELDPEDATQVVHRLPLLEKH